MSDVISSHLVIRKEKTKKHLKEYTYSYNMNHRSNEISKILKMAAF